MGFCCHLLGPKGPTPNPPHKSLRPGARKRGPGGEGSRPPLWLPLRAQIIISVSHYPKTPMRGTGPRIDRKSIGFRSVDYSTVLITFDIGRALSLPGSFISLTIISSYWGSVCAANFGRMNTIL